MRFFRFLGGVLLVVLTIGLIGSVFQAGYLAGAAGTTAGAVPAPWYGGWAYGWGFGGFHLLGTLFTIFIIFALLRLVFGGGRRDHGGGYGGGWGRGWGHGPWTSGGPNPGDASRFGPWEERARELHDDWHRRHGGAPSDAPAPAAGTPAEGRTDAQPTPNGGEGR